jgi:hypothetical protein
MGSVFDFKHISIPYYQNMQCVELGMDSRSQCSDKQWFDQYPDSVSYQFNHAGYRTHEKIMSDCVLVLGDSFTLGLGVNAEQRYTDILEKQLGHQVANFSLNGASNDWIARKLSQLLKIIKPRAVIVHYTFSHRRERARLDWHDDERTECEPFYSSQENFDNWRMNFDRINSACAGLQVIHSFIPNWHDSPVDYTQFAGTVITPCVLQDLARDKFHYGVLTHQHLANVFNRVLQNISYPLLF